MMFLKMTEMTWQVGVVGTGEARTAPKDHRIGAARASGDATADSLATHFKMYHLRGGFLTKHTQTKQKQSNA